MPERNLTSTANRLTELLSKERNHAEQLVQILTDEHEVLRDGEPEALVKISGRKHALVEDLEEIGKRRTVMVHQAGFSEQRDNILQMLSKLGDDHPVQKEWRRLLNSLEECKRQNIVNGGVIELAFRRNSQALSLLRGDSPESTTYGKNGRQGSNTGSRPIAQA